MTTLAARKLTGRNRLECFALYAVLQGLLAQPKSALQLLSNALLLSALAIGVAGIG